MLPFNKAITLWPDQIALVEGEQTFTYRQFGARVAALCSALGELELPLGARVAIIAPNGFKYMECYYAHALTGLVLMPINYRQSAQEIASILKDAEASALIVHPDFTENAVKVAGENKNLKAFIWLYQPGKEFDLSCPQYFYDQLIEQNEGASLPKHAPAGEDLAQLYYTSGTTGRPKGVMLSHDNVSTHALAAAYELGLSDQDAWFHIAPMFHLADAWSVFSVTWCGGKHVFLPYFKAKEVLETIQVRGVTMLAMVPTMANALVNDENLNSFSYQSLRMFLTAGAPIAPDLVRKIVNAFDCQYVQYYGMTETSPLLTLSLLKGHHESASKEEKIRIASRTGRSFLGVELKVVREDGTDVEADDTEVGEIVARGPGVTAGYWNQPEATEALIRNGWLHTGDLAVIDSEGYVNVVDRKKDMIITGGENVYSTEVEYVLYEHPAVLECAVFGIPDPRWGETVKAVVVKRPEAEVSEASLIEHVKTKIAHYKAPRSVEFISELPKTGSGKIFKRGLREQHLNSLPK